MNEKVRLVHVGWLGEEVSRDCELEVEEVVVVISEVEKTGTRLCHKAACAKPTANGRPFSHPHPCTSLGLILGVISPFHLVRIQRTSV